MSVSNWQVWAGSNLDHFAVFLWWYAFPLLDGIFETAKYKQQIFFFFLEMGASSIPNGHCIVHAQHEQQTWTCTDQYQTSHVTRKPVFGICYKVRLKPACSATESIEISSIASSGITLYRQRTIKALIRLRGCAGWSAPLLFAYGINRFAHDAAQIKAPNTCLILSTIRHNCCAPSVQRPIFFSLQFFYLACPCVVFFYDSPL